MNRQQKMLELENERQREGQYKKALAARAKQIAEFEGPANIRVLGQVPPRRVYGNALVGRVALVKPDDDLLDGGSEFYIGETYAVVDGISVFGWTTPVACTFYQGTKHHDLCPHVAAIRAFGHDSGQITNFVDERLHPDAPAEPFGKNQGLKIPAPPTNPKHPVPQPHRPTVDSAAANDDVSEGHTAGTLHLAPDLPPIRAEALMREQLLAPRTSSLGAVLSTLQPDQYELVAAPATKSMIIEGQPGTGKTIVGSHRAAYLVNEDTPSAKTLPGRILLVGPTEGYSNHVRHAVRRLAGESSKVTVLSLTELAEEIIGEKQHAQEGPQSEHPHLPWQLAKVVRSAIDRRTARSWSDSPARPFQAYEYLRSSPVITELHPEWTSYRRQLPPYREALSARDFAPLIAFIHWEIAKPQSLTDVQHVIVDEAQDVTPLEWVLLDGINVGDHWTILGDLNQRRSEHTLSTWREVLEVIKIRRETPVLKMSRGYRSTRPILEYANQLLPRDQRTIIAFQESGPKPTVRKVMEKDLGQVSFSELERLIAAYPAGTVSAICQTPGIVDVWLHLAGWVHDSKEGAWRKGTQSVRVLLPDAARGLEFDGVVVVEPAHFPTRYGRLGTLYTALTRANRELSVVHAAPLPKALRQL